MTPATLWRRVFYVLCTPWSLLMGWYALDLSPGERLDALAPWAVGSVAAAAFALLGRGLHGAVQAWSARPSHRGASAVPAAPGAASAASTEPTLQLRACFARLAQHPPECLAAQLAPSPSHAPLLADDLPDPGASLAERGMALQVRLAQAMDMVVSHMPSAGPVPVFTLAPTLTPDSRYAAADWPGLMAAQATVRPPLLRAVEQNGPSLAPVLQALHTQFSASPMLCNAVLLSVDGELIRGHYSSHRRDPDTPRPPPVHDSVVVLWTTRDGLPAALRQQAVDANSTEGKRARQAMAWWSREMDSVHALFPDEAQTRVLPTATVDALLKAYRASDDPELADHARAARMLGDDTWHPVPWTTQQVEAYDAASVLANLPPPLHLPLHDAHGKRLPALECEHAIAAGWQALCARLPDDQAPWRVWHDSRADAAITVALRLALRGLLPPVDLDDPARAVDLATRLGPLGSGAGGAALALAAACPGGHVVVIADDNGGLLLQPVITATPPQAPASPLPTSDCQALSGAP